MKNKLVERIYHRINSKYLNLLVWVINGFNVPAPQLVKWSVLRRCHLSESDWIETGTYLGDTTRFLGKISNHVYTIEPSPELFARATRRFTKVNNITVINGSSEEKLIDAINLSTSSKICFWLDGHYSEGITFQGENDTPIKRELEVIRENLMKFSEICICVDDVRCFDRSNEEYSSYPDKDFLITWANQNHFNWKIEHDIFIANRTIE